MVETPAEPEELTLGDLGLSLGESLATGMRFPVLLRGWQAKIRARTT